MGATVTGKNENDTGKILSVMKDLGKDMGDIDKSLDKLRKLAAVITKKPDECKKSMDSLCDVLGDVLTVASGWKNLPKSLTNCVYK